MYGQKFNELKDKISEILSDSSSGYKFKIFKRKYPELYKQIIEVTKEYNPKNIVESVYIILAGPYKFCEFNTDKKKASFINYEKGYRKFCSTNCFCSIQSLKDKHLSLTLDEKNNINTKRRQTCTAKYGVDNVSKVPDILLKINNINLEKYGTKYPIQLNEMKIKRTKTCLNIYGVEHPAQSMVIRDKMKQTSMDRFGVEHYWQKFLTKEQLNILQNKDEFLMLINNKSISNISYESKLSPTTIIKYAKLYGLTNALIKTNISTYELKIQDILEKHNINYVKNNRTIIKPLELDFYIPDFKLAIEVGSEYFHCESTDRSSNYHYNKWKQCKEKGIHLHQYFDNDLSNHINLIEYYIRYSSVDLKESNLNLTFNVINDESTIIDFVKQYHFNDLNLNNDLIIGAFCHDRLIGISVWNDFELLQFIFDINYHVPNLINLMIKYMRLITNINGDIIYKHNNFYCQKLFIDNGFEIDCITNPTYYLTEDNSKLWNAGFTIFKNKLTESQIMESLNYGKIFDCGSVKYAWTK